MERASQRAHALIARRLRSSHDRDVTDRDLRELQRSADAAPEDGAARLDLARALARAGQRDDAVEACYRARLFGGDAELARELLRSLGAPCSPWSHRDGDAANTRCAPVRGARKGEVVASVVLPSAGPVVITEDGSVVVGQDGGVVSFLDGRTLAVREEQDLPGCAMGRAELLEIAAGGDGRIVVASAGKTVFEVNEKRVQLVRERADAAPFLHPRFLPSGVMIDTSRVALDRSSAHAVAPAVAEGLIACAFTDGGDEDSRTVQLRLLERYDRVRASLQLDAPSNRLISPVAIAIASQGHVYALLTHIGGNVGGSVWQSELALISSDGVVESRRLIGEGLHVQMAVGHPELCWVLGFEALLRIARDGGVLRLPRVGGEWGGLLVDRNSVAYASSPSSLEAFDPDGHKLFELPSPSTPVAIDALNRLLALRPVEAGVEMIAIA
jgi:hypothetical protein